MIEVIQADSFHKEIVIDLLDEFVWVCHTIIKTGKTAPKRTDYDNPVFDDVIKSKDSAIFIAKNDNTYIWILTIHTLKLIRKWNYWYCEIEEMYVKESYQGTGVAQELIKKAICWCNERNIKSIQLKSHFALEQAHNFYEKEGFTAYGKAFEKKL